VLIVGLTGGIGSGKSTVAELFAARGVPYIDADQLTRQLVAPGSALLAEIVGTFGDGMLDRDGRLDRRRMREQVFSDPTARERLEGLLHPAVYAAMRERIASLDAPYCLLVIVIPLLVETGGTQRVHRVLVIDIGEAEQRARTAERDGVDPDQVDAILASQATRTERLEAADDVIDNRGDRAQLDSQVEKLHRHYLELAAERAWPSPLAPRDAQSRVV
jgi:dephospho-CoA kinase